MKNLSFQILEHNKTYQGKLRVDRYRLRHEKMAGGWSEDHEREVMTIGPVAAVVPYDPVRDEILLIEQFRAGAMSAGDENPWMIEPIAGLVTDTESPEEVATREAIEEAGCEIIHLEQIGKIHPSPGGLSQLTSLFIGRVSTESVKGIFGVEEENEETRPLVIKYADVSELLSSSRITNGITIIALQWILLNHDPLRKRWLSNSNGIAAIATGKTNEPAGPR